MSAAGDEPRDEPTSPMSSDEFEQRLIDLHRTGHTVPGMRAALAEWFKLDTWTRDEGLQLLLGLSPGPFHRAGMFRGCSDVDGVTKTECIFSARYLDSSLVCLLGYRNACAWMASASETVEELPLTSFDLLHLGITLRRYEDIWDSGQHPARCTPAFFVEWATGKDLAVPWLEWAMADGLVARPEDAREAEQAASRAVSKAAQQGEPPTIHRTNRGRQGDAFSVLIEAGMREAQDPTIRSSVWAAMEAIARRPNAPAPLLGADDEGIKFADERADGGFRYYTPEHLRDRLRKRRP